MAQSGVLLHIPGIMTRHSQRPRPQVEVIPASAEQSPILANLLELYVHDFSAFLDVELGLDGRFGYPNLDLYWSKPGRHPFLIRVDGKIAGFLLVKKGSEFSGNHSVLDMAEFFILRRYRRQGIGTEVAHQVWRQFPGPWEVRVMPANGPALEFWRRAIAEFIAESVEPIRVEKPGKSWQVFSFDSPR